MKRYGKELTQGRYGAKPLREEIFFAFWPLGAIVLRFLDLLHQVNKPLFHKVYSNIQDKNSNNLYKLRL